MTNKSLHNQIQIEQHEQKKKKEEKTRSELRCSWRVSRSFTTSGATRVTVKQHKHHLIWKWCWTPVCVN